MEKKEGKIIQLDGEIITYLEFLHYNVEAYKVILTEILTKTNPQGKCLYSLENYRHFMDEYREATLEYGAASRQIMIDHAPEYLNDDDYELFFDFSKATAEVKRKSSGCGTGGCSCGK